MKHTNRLSRLCDRKLVQSCLRHVDRLRILTDYTNINNNRAIYTRKNKTRLILDEMCRLYGKFASYLRRVLFFLVIMTDVYI